MKGWVVRFFLIWLGLLVAVGFFATSFSTYSEAKCNIKNQLPYYRWDSFWYTSIARHGYTFSEEKNSSIAFFPLYPAVIRGTYEVTGLREDRLALGLNILFSFLSVLFLYRLARMDYPERAALAIVAVFLFFPQTYFFLSGYPDVLFVLLAILSLYFVRRGQWGRAGIAAGLLAITKPYGIFMLPVLFVEYWQSHDRDLRDFLKRWDWLPLLLPLVSFGGFVLFNSLAFHDPFAFFAAQKTWGRSLANPAAALLEEAQHYLFQGHILTGSNFPYLVYVVDLFFALIAAALSWRRVRRSYLIFPGLILFSALLTGTLTSFGRYSLLGFPLMFGPAVYLSEKKHLFTGYLAISVLSLLALSSLFVRCYSVE